MGAMTWWDHKTLSVWSQPWGTAIKGPLKGTALTLLPVSLEPWSTWLQKHPDTTVLDNRRYGGRRYPAARPSDAFVIGVALEEHATAYYFTDLVREGVVNDRIGPYPVAVFADGRSRDVAVFLRRPSGQGDLPDTLTFQVSPDGVVTDVETGSQWDITGGVAVEGSLRGATLLRLPYISAYDWAWADFYPHTRFYGRPESSVPRPPNRGYRGDGAAPR